MIQTNCESDYIDKIYQCNVGKRWFYRYASSPMEYVYDVEPKKDRLLALLKSGVDLFSFVQRTFVDEKPEENRFPKEFENIAIMTIKSYDDWWAQTIKKKERQNVKKAEKSGVKVRKVELNESFFKGVQKIYNETPFREGRRYSGYGLSLSHIRDKFKDIGDSDILGAYIDEELIGLLWLTFGDNAAMFRSFVSFIKYRDNRPNNALIAEAVRTCSKRHISFLVYGNHYGFLPSLDIFRERQGFRKFSVPRFFVPLTSAGQLAIKLGVHRKIEYTVPLTVERSLLRLYVPVSRVVPAAIWWRFGGE